MMSGLFNRGGEVACENRLRRMAVSCTAAIVAVCAAIGAAPTNGHAETSSAAVAWGFNHSWQLGAGYETNPGENTPVAVVGLNNITAVAASEKFTLALLSDGTVRSWGGRNTQGQLGDGVRGTKEIVNGQLVTVSGLSKVKAISASALHAMALLTDGTLRVWGANEAGSLGNGLVNPRERYNKKRERYETTMMGTGSPVPVQVRDKGKPLTGVEAIASGGGSNFALSSGGTVLWAWGRNESGQLGTGQKGPFECKDDGGPVECDPTPRHAMMPQPVQNKEAVITAISAGANFTLALLTDGSVWSWGSNGHGQLGTNAGDLFESAVPVEVQNINKKAVAISAGHEHALALLSTGKVVGWGTNGHGQLGNVRPEGCMNEPCNKVPKPIPGLENVMTEIGLEKVTAISAGSGYSLALRNGKVLALGRNRHGELGTGNSSAESSKPEEVTGIGPVRAIAAGNVFAVALLENVEIGLSPQVVLTQHKNALTLSWAFRAAEYKARLFECEEEEGEEEEGEEEGEEEQPTKERKCVAHPEISREIITKASQPEAYRERQWTFSEDKDKHPLEKGQPYEAVLRSFTGLGETGEERAHFIFESPGLLPAINGLTPNAGPLLGKTAVRIGGYKFTPGATVKFGNVAAQNVTVVSENLIIAEAPAGIEGTVPVTVTTGAGTSKERPVDQYTYAAVPTVSKVEPKSGGVGDHTTVRITGTNLLKASGVNFGSVGSAKVTGTEATWITAVTPVEPLESVRTVNVTVTTPGGTSQVVLTSKFQYTPTVASLSPSEGPKGGGTTVTVTGSGFARGRTATTFKFGSTSATSVNCASANVCTVASPAHGEKAKVHVKATVKEITSPATSEDYFTYS